MIDDPGYTQAVLTVEGTAPYQVAGTQFTQSRRAVRYLEATVFHGSTGCGQGNQEGNNPYGSGAESCTYSNTGAPVAVGAN
jgi:hypothetical protein